MKILIENSKNYHYEILESIIVKFPLILKLEDYNITLRIHKNKSYVNYISDKYPLINIEGYKSMCKYEEYDYIINATVYPLELLEMEDRNNSYYILHDSLDYYEIGDNIIDRCYNLTPLCKKSKLLECDILPYSENKEIDECIMIVQGNFNRRDIDLLEDILLEDYGIEYKIRMIGRGELPVHIVNHPRIEYYVDLDFESYHKKFLDVYGIIPLITRENNGEYYLNKLTSSINYGKGYNLVFFVDKDLDDIYNLDRKIIYNRENVCDKFRELLLRFNNKKI